MDLAGVARVPGAQNFLEIERDPKNHQFSKGHLKITIQQFPTEEVDFTLSLTEQLSSMSGLRQCHWTFKNNCKCGNSKVVAHLKLDLEFENYLHEMSNDYQYRVTCDITDRLGKQQQICSFKEIRILKSMNFLVKTKHRLDCMIRELGETMVSVEIERFCMNPNVLRNKIQRDFQALLNNPVFSDVTIQVGDKRYTEMKAHKCILSCRSDVFKCMFNSTMTESQTGIVKIPDVSPEVMRQLLHYIYTGKIETFDENTVDLFQAAVKYQMEDLKSDCIEYFIFNVNFESFANFSKLVNMYDVGELREKVSAFMKKCKRIIQKNN